MPGPLDGYRVIDLTTMVSGPVATMLLGDQGADVIKVEPLGRGDGVRGFGLRNPGFSPMFVAINRNKRSLAIDLKNERGLEVLKRLVKGADVFVQNFRPGRIERLGLGEKALREVRPDLVYVSISGFGESGPYADQRVYDPIVQALSGLADVQADETGRPRMVRLIVPDKLTGITAAQAITAALLARERTGVGQHVRLSMLDAMVSFLWPEGMATFTYVKGGERRASPLPRRDLVFETADGYITTGAVSDGEWQGLAKALEHPEWLEDPRFATAADRWLHIEERYELTAEALLNRTADEWLERLRAEDVPCAPVNRRKDLLTDPQVVENGIIIETQHPTVGRIRFTRPAARFDETPADALRPAPALGEHSDDVLGEIGISQEEIRVLRETHVVG